MRLWDWSVAAWKKPGVEALALELQDIHGQHPPVLLWAAWAAAEGRPLDADTIEEACDVARAWEAAAIATLRELRRTLKKPIPDVDDAARESLRAQVRAAEFAAERSLIEQLETLTPPAAGAPLPMAPALVETARAWGRTVPRSQLGDLAAKLSA